MTEWNCGRTNTGNQRALGQEQEVDCFLLALDVLADLIHIADKAHVCLHEMELALGIQRLTFRRNAIPGFLGAAQEVDAGLTRVFGELL